MKITIKLAFIITIIASLLSLTALAADYYVFDAGDLKDTVSFVKNMSLKNDQLLENNSAYISTGPLEDDYTSTNDTGIIVNLQTLMQDIKIKEYPVLKIGYKAMTEVTDTQMTINVTVDQTENPKNRLYCATLNYNKTGNDEHVIFNLATTQTGVKTVGEWEKVTEDSPLYELRIKPYVKLKVMNEGDYFDLEYIAFFKTEEDALAYNFELDSSLDEIIFNKQVVRIVKDKTTNLDYTFAPYYANTQAVTFSSDNPQIATVDNTGKVTGISAGVTTIRAIASGHSTTCKVYVLESELAPIDIVSERFVSPTLIS